MTDCPHDDLRADCECYENPTEPLSIRVTCNHCDRHIDVVVEDLALLDWSDD